MSESPSQTGVAETAPRWRPLEAVDRRVLGVLIEKAKTTPDNYPLSLNALRNGCNQKSNRFPQMALEEDAVEESLERLRELGAVSVIQGGGRVDKFRHLAYEWLGVDKVELAVMAELLLRGAQTIGELRGRAARMEPIKGLDELRPILDQLVAKRLLVYLTPPGRGALVTHALYLDREMEKVRREYGGGAIAESTSPAPADAPVPAATGEAQLHAHSSEEIRQLREELAALRTEFDRTKMELAEVAETLRRQLDELNRQLEN